MCVCPHLCLRAGGAAEEGAAAGASVGAADCLPSGDCWAGGGAGGGDQGAAADWAGEHPVTAIHGEDAGGERLQQANIILNTFKVLRTREGWLEVHSDLLLKSLIVAEHTKTITKWFYFCQIHIKNRHFSIYMKINILIILLSTLKRMHFSETLAKYCDSDPWQHYLYILKWLFTCDVKPALYQISNIRLQNSCSAWCLYSGEEKEIWFSMAWRQIIRTRTSDLIGPF